MYHLSRLISNRRLLLLLPALQPFASFFSTSPTKRRTKPDKESPLSPEDVAHLGFLGGAVNKEEVVELKQPSPRPSTIAFQPRVANSVQLVGNVGEPVRLTDGTNQSVFSLLVKQNNYAKDPKFWIPIIFEGELAHVAACYLKKNDLVYVAGQLTGDFAPFKSSDGQAKIQVLAHELCYVNNDYPQNYNHVVYERKMVISKASGEGTKKEDKKKLWSDLVANPTDWVDYRTGKQSGSKNSRHPDFKHKDTKESLWLDTAPDWVSEKLDSLVFHTSYNTMNRGKITFGTKTGKGYNSVAGSFGRDASALSDKKTNEDSWKDLVENPNKWWDNRSNKLNPKSPDFKHKDLGTALWVSDAPKWAVAKLPPSYT